VNVQIITLSPLPCQAFFYVLFLLQLTKTCSIDATYLYSINEHYFFQQMYINVMPIAKNTNSQPRQRA